MIPSLARRAAVASLCGAALLAPHGALAQAGQCTPTDAVTAEVNSRQGVEMARQGDYEGALALFRVAAKLDACEPEYPLLQARALGRTGRREEAVGLYNQVVSAFPGTPAAERAIRERDALKAQAPVGDPSGKPTTEGIDWPLVGYVGAGFGALMVAGGVIFALDAQSADDDIPSAIARGDRGRYDELVSQRDSSSTLSYVFYGLGGALIIGGVSAVLFAPEARESTPQITVVPDPRGGAHFGWTVRF
ncbi:MAG: tetratricopeptide repeat protein [Bradymonadia bacterium]